MARLLSSSFKSVKPHHPVPKPKPDPPSTPSKSLPIKSSHFPSSSSSPPSPSPSPSPSSSASKSKSKSNSRWSVYLILSTNPPIKTYVGVTTNFSRRLKQHNGELKGGAKASRAGRPWICACLIRGFQDRSEACAFETRWKQLSRKLPRKGKGNEAQKLEETKSGLLLKHRYTALDQVKNSIDCSHLKIDCHSNLY